MFKPKIAAQDYSVSMLPHNRKEVFFDVFKLHWKSFLAYGLLIFLFSLPMHFFALIEKSYEATVMQGYESLSQDKQQEIYVNLLSMRNTRAVFNILSYLLLSVGIAGLIRVVRQYAWEENVFFGTDFSTGIKQNIGQMALLGLIVGVISALSVYAYNLSALTTNKLISIVLMLPVGFSIFIVLPTVAYTVVSISIYSNKFSQNLLTGLAIAAKAPFKTFLALICCFIPFIPQVIPNIYCIVFGRLVGCLLAPLVMLGWFLFASNQFDKYINADKFPTLVGRGTYPLPEKEDETVEKKSKQAAE